MSDFVLTAQSPLGGIQQTIKGVTITEITNRAIVSIAMRIGGEGELAKAIAASYKTKIPTVGQSTISKVANARFLGMQQDQLFLLFDHPESNPEDEVADKLGAGTYLTDQSDGWVTICLSGPDTGAALERICMVDLHPDVFLEGQVARTMMEHLSVIIVREGEDAFLLMSPRSSAKSFLHALETSARNISPHDFERQSGESF